METKIISEEKYNHVASEMMFVGALYEQNDLFVQYGGYIKSDKDFSDVACKFFFDLFETMYITFAERITEEKIIAYLSNDYEMLSTYRKHGGWKTIKDFKQLADIEDISNYFSIIKKYSLCRALKKVGFPVEKIISHKDFSTMDADKVYALVRAKIDKIATDINCSNESISLTSGNNEAIKSFLSRPTFGIQTPFYMWDDAFMGFRKAKCLAVAMLSNNGKTRLAIMIAAYVAFIQKKRVLLLFNETDEQDTRMAMLVAVLNGEQFKKMHGVQLKKCEREIVMGQYRDENGNFVERKVDEWGIPTETEEEYMERVMETQEYKDVQKVADYIDSNSEGLIFYKDVSSDYSNTALEFEIKKNILLHQVDYVVFDTAKPYKEEKWELFKAQVTFLKELAASLNVFIYLSLQMTDDTIHVDNLDLSSMNIANCKHVKHVLDMLLLAKLIDREDYNKYEYIPENVEWGGEPKAQKLKDNETYMSMVVDKNRAGDKRKSQLFRINLDRNEWECLGWIRKQAEPLF